MNIWDVQNYRGLKAHDSTRTKRSPSTGALLSIEVAMVCRHDWFQRAIKPHVHVAPLRLCVSDYPPSEDIVASHLRRTAVRASALSCEQTYMRPLKSCSERSLDGLEKCVVNGLSCGSRCKQTQRYITDRASLVIVKHPPGSIQFNIGCKLAFQWNVHQARISRRSSEICSCP